MDVKHFEKIKLKYGQCASWALWRDDDVRNLEIIDKSINKLKNDIVMTAWNISKEIDFPLGNFHKTANDAKLSYTINNSLYRGAYITDLIKDYKEGNSFKVKKHLTLDIERKHINYFIDELKCLGGSIKLIIAIGWNAYNLLLKYKFHEKCVIKRMTHYSYRFNGCHKLKVYSKRVHKELGL